MYANVESSINSSETNEIMNEINDESEKENVINEEQMKIFQYILQSKAAL